jgi:hypothetical protein
MTFAQNEEIAEGVGTAPGPAPITLGVPALDGLILMGTAQNSNDPTATVNDVFTLDPVSGDAVSVLSQVNTWGMTADLANSRMLFTRSSGLTPPPGLIGGGDELFEVPFAGGTPTSLGRITDSAGEGFRVDGLAISGGVLYGSHAGGTTNGLYEIDWGTLQVTLMGSFSNSISGIDADPDTGIIYGVDDSGGALVSISTAGAVTPVEPYPGGYSDIDGLAVGGGIAYLVSDEAGLIPVYDLVAGSYGSPLLSPFTASDVFSAAGIAEGDAPPDDGGSDDGGGGGVPATTGIGIALLVILLGGGGAYFLRRK